LNIQNVEIYCQICKSRPIQFLGGFAPAVTSFIARIKKVLKTLKKNVCEFIRIGYKTVYKAHGSVVNRHFDTVV